MRERKEAQAQDSSQWHELASVEQQGDSTINQTEIAIASHDGPEKPTERSPKHKSSKKEPMSEEQRVQRKRRRNYRLKVILGLAMPFTLQALDTTIIASALPFIAKDFSKQNLDLVDCC